jgi:16S rRNA processing protein RimM
MRSTGDDDVPWPEDAVEVARIVDAFGIKGWIRVQPYAAQPEALFSSKRWFLLPSAERPRPAGAAPLPRVLRITQSQAHRDGVVAAAQELADRGAAESLKGARVFVSRTSFPTADEGEYYWIDLIGLAVINREGHVLGTVADLLDTGPHSVLRIAPGTSHEAGEAAAAEILIPFVAAYVDQVDLPQRRIVVDWGLDY